MIGAEEKLLTVRQAAARFGCSSVWIYRLIKEGVVDPVIRGDGVHLVREDELAAAIALRREQKASGIDDGLLSSTQLCEAAGITPRMLHHWRERGWLRAHRRSTSGGAPSDRIPDPIRVGDDFTTGSGYFLRWAPDAVERARELKRASDIKAASLPEIVVLLREIEAEGCAL